MRLVFMLYWVAFVLESLFHIKTVIGGVTYEIGVHAILESFCAGFCSHIKTVFGADLLISSKTVT